MCAHFLNHCLTHSRAVVLCVVCKHSHVSAQIARLTVVLPVLAQGGDGVPSKCVSYYVLQRQLVFLQGLLQNAGMDQDLAAVLVWRSDPRA